MIDKRNRSQSHTGSAAEVDDYQQTIMEHDRKPSNNMVCFDCNHRDEGFNPFCGDHIVLYVKLEKDVISNITFQGELCAISKSSASMMTEALKGKTISEAEKLFGNFQGIFNGHVISPDEQSLLGELAAFNSIKDSPARIKCANLPWQTMKSLLHTRKEAITSEL
ncbi:MAG: Fe-S cluster assembly sulfur transfer protein SufU [Ignavibacteriales bacterium]